MKISPLHALQIWHLLCLVNVVACLPCQCCGLPASSIVGFDWPIWNSGKSALLAYRIGRLLTSDDQL